MCVTGSAFSLLNLECPKQFQRTDGLIIFSKTCPWFYVCFIRKVILSNPKPNLPLNLQLILTYSTYPMRTDEITCSL